MFKQILEDVRVIMDLIDEHVPPSWRGISLRSYPHFVICVMCGWAIRGTPDLWQMVCSSEQAIDHPGPLTPERTSALVLMVAVCAVASWGVCLAGRRRTAFVGQTLAFALYFVFALGYGPIGHWPHLLRSVVFATGIVRANLFLSAAGVPSTKADRVVACITVLLVLLTETWWIANALMLTLTQVWGWIELVIACAARVPHQRRCRRLLIGVASLNAAAIGALPFLNLNLVHTWITEYVAICLASTGALLVLARWEEPENDVRSSTDGIVRPPPVEQHAQRVRRMSINWFPSGRDPVSDQSCTANPI